LRLLIATHSCTLAQCYPHATPPLITASYPGRYDESASSAIAKKRVALVQLFRRPEHQRVLERASAATERIESKVSKSHDNGGLRFFNEEYKRRRVDAALAGRPFVGYAVAKARLRKAIASVAAGDTGPLIARVFDRSDVG
jgi:hypothetical protein